MRFANIRRAFLSLVGLSLTYVAYAICVVPFVEPSVSQTDLETETEHDTFSRSTDRYVRELTPLFPEGSWELDHPKVLRSQQATILLQTFEEMEDGRLHVKPCTIVFYGSDRSGKDTNPTIMQAPQGVMLSFDAPFDLSSGGFPKLVSGQSDGGIRIVRGGDKNSEGVVLVTSNVVISNNQIWTREQVNFRLGDTYGTGSGLLITRAESRAKSPADAESVGLLDDLSIIRLQQLDQLSFRMEQGDLFDSFTNAASGPATQIAGKKPTSSTQVVVRSQGPLILDLNEMKATLEDHVTITRQQPGQPHPDTLSATHLTMLFDRVDPQDPPQPSDAKQTKSSPTIEIAKLTAVGSPLVIHAPSQQVHMTSKQLEYEFASRTLRLFGSNPNSASSTPQKPGQVRLRGPDYQITVPSVEFVNHEDRSKWRLISKGAGSLQGSHDGQNQVQASWTRGFSMTPVQDQQRLVIEGNATVQTPGTGSVNADAIELSLLQVEHHVGTRLDGTSVMKTKAVPTRIVTRATRGGKTKIDSAQFGGSLTLMDIRFRRNPNPAAPFQPASHGQRDDNSPNQKTETKYHVDGGELTAWVDPDTREVHRMIVRGSSRVVEETVAGQRPFQLEGNAIDMTLVGGVPVVEIKGNPARIGLPELDVVGNSIQFDGTQNSIHIPGAGSLTIQVTKEFLGRVANQEDRSGRIARPPVRQPGPTVLQPIDVSWTDELHFDGQIVHVVGKAKATGEDLSFATSDVKITLDRMIDLSQPNDAGKVRPELKFVSARGGVSATIRSRDELTNAPKSYQQVSAQDLDVDFTTGDITASGPGSLSYTSADNLMPSIGSVTSAQDSERSTSGELSHFSVAFNTQLKGNMNRREAHLYENIHMWLGPVKQWNTIVDPSQRPALRKNDVWMSCYELFVLESPTAVVMENRKPIELLARGDAYVEGQLYAAKGHQIKYAEEKGMMTLEGDAKRPAELWQRKSANEQGTSSGRVRRIRYWHKSQEIELGLIGFDVSTARTSPKK